MGKTSKRVPARKNQTSFKSGNKVSKGGQKGNLQYDREALIAKKVDSVMVTNYITLNSHLTLAQLEARLKDPEISSIELGIVRGFIDIAKTGSLGSLGFYLDRLIGRPVQPVEHSKKDPFKDLTLEQLQKLKEEISLSNRQSMKLIEQTPRAQAQEKIINAEFSRTTAVGSANGIKK